MCLLLCEGKRELAEERKKKTRGAEKKTGIGLAETVGGRTFRPNCPVPPQNVHARHVLYPAMA